MRTKESLLKLCKYGEMTPYGLLVSGIITQEEYKLFFGEEDD